MTKNNHTALNSYFDLKCHKILSNDFPDKIQNHPNFNEICEQKCYEIVMYLTKITTKFP